MRMMKAVALLPALAVAAVVAMSAQARAEDVTLYSNRYFSGEKKVVEKSWNGRSSWGNRTRAIRVPQGVRVTVYSATDYKGLKKVITSDWALKPTDTWNGRIRSVRVEGSGAWWDNNKPTSPSSRPVLYSGSNWNGQSLALAGNWSGSGRIGTVRSIRVPSGWYVTIYSERSYQGTAMRLLKDWSISSGTWRHPVRSARIGRLDGGSGGSWDGRTTIYSQRDFGGVARTLTGDWSGDSSWDGSPYGIHSIRVAPGTRLTLFDQPGYRGTQTTITESWNPASGAWWAGRIRSIRISSGGSSGGGSSDNGYASLYSQRNYYGSVKTITGDWSGDSSWDGSPYSVNSIKVRKGSVLTCYSESNYRGASMVVTSDWSPAPGNWWAGRIRSIRMSTTGDAPSPRPGATGAPWTPGRR